MKRLSFFLTFVIVMAMGITAFGQVCEVTISDVTETFDDNTLSAGKTHVITLNFNAACSPTTPGNHSYNATNGFTIYSNDGANFGGVQGAMTDAYENGLGWAQSFTNHFEWDGTAFQSAAAGNAGPAYGDKVAVAFGGVAFACGDGLPGGYNDAMGTITFTTREEDTLSTICIDSAFTPPGGAWKWASLCGDPIVYAEWYSTPKCWSIYKVPDPQPVIHNCVEATKAYDHCAVATYQFDWYDEDGEGNDVTDQCTWEMVSGVGTIDNSGMWAYSTPPQSGTETVEVLVRDNIGQPTNCTFEITFTNQAPTIACPTSAVTISTGDTKTQTVVTDDDCDALTVSYVSHSPADGGDVVNVVGNDVSFTPSGTDPRPGVVMIVEVSDGLETATCEMLWDVITTAPYIIQIEKEEGPDGKGALQGHFADVSVTLNSILVEQGFGAFDILIAYDQSVLSFQQALEGDIYDDCGWEYFTYRFGPDGNCGNACPSGMTRVVGIAETNNGPYHPGCAPTYVSTLPVTLFDLRFLVSNDRTFECMYAPVRFFWIDCGDNTASNADGTELYISSKVFDFDNAIPMSDGTIGFPTYQGAQDFCLEGEVQKLPPIRNIDFQNGGVDIVCADSIDARGDINLNGLAYEIADAVMLTNYFINGLGAFEYVEGSIAASDANADGIPLSVADLVYLIRVVVGDALPYPKVDPTVGKYFVNGDVVSTEIELGAALIVFEGNVVPTNHTDLEMVYGMVDGNTNVLLYSTDANEVASGKLVTADGAVLKLEGATYEGQPVNFDLVPGSFEVAQNYPNPFNPTTVITFQAPGVNEATVTIYNTIGQKVDQMTVQTQNGFGEVSWDASALSSGIYFYKVVAGEYTATKKAILLK